MSRLLFVVLLAIVAPRIALADEDRITVKIVVGETREIEVGFARMHFCDDTSIVEAEMRDKSLETNVFVVKGLKPGTTECRAGLDPDRPTFLFSITVEKSKPDAKPKRPVR